MDRPTWRSSKRKSRKTSNPPPANDALKAALRWLAQRELSVAALRKRLQAKGFDPDEVYAAIEWLSSQRILDDARLAERIAAPKSDSRNAMGRAKTRERLERAGVDPETVEAALAGTGDEDELRAMAALLAKKYPGGADPGKANRFLASRGFEEDLIATALERWRGE